MSQHILLDTKEERSGDKGEVLLAVAVFPPGGKKREDEEPRGNRVGHWTAKRWMSNRGHCPAMRVKLARFPKFPLMLT